MNRRSFFRAAIAAAATVIARAYAPKAIAYPEVPLEPFNLTAFGDVEPQPFFFAPCSDVDNAIHYTEDGIRAMREAFEQACRNLERMELL